MKMVVIKRLCSSDVGFDQDLKKLVAWDDQLDANVHLTVKTILQDIKDHGDQALVQYTQKFDGLEVASASELEVPQARLQQALDGLAVEQRSALEISAKRVFDYHQLQK